MSSQDSGPGSAPWSSLFQSHVSKLPSPEFVLSTLHPHPTAKGSYLPRARYCIYRGMWTQLPENKHNDAPRNSELFASDCPTFTTDARMEKPGELFASGGTPDSEVGREGHKGSESGGGGPVEAVWWIKEEGIMAQWRIKGVAWVVGRDIEGQGAAAKTAKAAIEQRMRKLRDSSEDWSWTKEITAHFGNISPGMRGSFKNPPPGKAKAPGEPDESHKLGQKVEGLDDEIARANFRVVVIIPHEVERVELADPEKARRVTYSYNNGQWEEKEQWP